METYSLIPKENIRIKDYWVSPDTLVELEMLARWLEGFEAGGHGRVIGHFELVMHLRSLIYQYNEQRKEKK